MSNFKMVDTSNPTLSDVEQYYTNADRAYRNWGPDPKRQGIYALHFGFHEEGGPEDNWSQVRAMTQRVIQNSGIKDGDHIVDAGCGTGALSFEIADQFPKSTVTGINITQSHIDTAEQYKRANNIRNVTFLNVSYDSTGLPSTVFDRVLFMESFCHGFNKPTTLNEACRILKPNGTLFIADTFTHSSEPSLAIKDRLRIFERGWFLPETMDVDGVSRLLSTSGFRDVNMTTVTPNALPSVKLMADHAEMRLKEDSNQDENLIATRKACVETYRLMSEDIIGYFFITARKS